MNKKTYSVYIMANSTNAVIYIGVTNNLERRVAEHQSGTIEGFTKKYKCNKLVHYESTGYVLNAIEREKEIKKWRREKKNILIELENSGWLGLSESW